MTIKHNVSIRAGELKPVNVNSNGISNKSNKCIVSPLVGLLSKTEARFYFFPLILFFVVVVLRPKRDNSHPPLESL